MNFPTDWVVYTAAGGVLVNGDRYLVLFRPKRREYRLPKGHVEEGETVPSTALREVTEESGYAAEAIADLGEQLVEFDSDGKHYARTERYFLMKLKDGERRHEGEAQFEPLWLPFDEALHMLTFESEKEWLRRANKARGDMQLQI